MGKPTKVPAGMVVNVGGAVRDEDRDDDALVDSPTANDLDLESFMDEFVQEQGRSYETKVAREIGGYHGENAFLFAFTPGQLTFTGLQLKLQAEYGPGDYRVRTFQSYTDADGRRRKELVKGGNFKIVIGATLGGARPGADGFNPLAIAGGDKSSLALLEKLLESKARPANGVDPMLHFIMESNKNTMTLMLGVMGMVMNGRKSDADPIAQLVKLGEAQRLLGLAPGGHEEPDTFDRVLTTAERVLPSLFNAVGVAHANRPAPTAPGGSMTLARPAPASGAAIDPALLATLQAHADLIGKLPMALQFGVDPVTVADQLLEGIGDDEAKYAALKGWVGHPQLVDAILAVMPGLAPQRAALTTWIGEFAASILNAEVEDGDDGDAGDGGHPLGNEDPDA